MTDAVFLVDLTLRATSVLLAATLVAWLFRRRSASVRYVLWVAAFSGLLALPVLSLNLPAWRVLPALRHRAALESDVVTGTAAPMIALEQLPPPTEELHPIGENVPAASPVAAPRTAAVRTSATKTSHRWPKIETVLLSLWATGCILFLARIGVSHFWMQSAIRKADVTRSGPLRAALDQLTREFGWKRRVNLVVTRTETMPMACGLITPTILLPPQSKDWTRAQGRCVLLHEFGHILRRDPLWKLLIELGRAVYWFHPLSWLAARWAAADRERACDDLVLRSGVSAADYARHLLDVVSGGRLRGLNVAAGVAMASTRRLDRRLRSLMDAAQDRRPLRRFTVTTTLLLGLCLLAPIATLRTTDASQAADGPAEPSTQTEDSVSEVWEVRMRAVDDATGDPIPNPRFIVQLSGDRWTEHAGDGNGEFVAKFATRAPSYCYLKVRADGYAAMQGFWSNGRDEPLDELPDELVFEMEPSITVGGVVVDEEGDPVDGATVYFGAANDARNEGRRIRQQFWREPTTSDAEGRWQCSLVSPGVDSASIRVEHPDFVKPDPHINFGLADQLAELKEQMHRWTLLRGFTIRGRVVNGNGQPIEGAVLGVGESNLYREAGPFPRTDADGRFEFPRVAALHYRGMQPDVYEMTVTAIKPGFAPAIELIPGFGGRELEPSTTENRIVDVTLRPGNSVGFNIRDTEGDPVPDVRVRLGQWNDTDSLSVLQQFGIPRNADAEGRWNWDWAPKGEVAYGFGAEGFRDQQLSITADGSSREVILEREQVITGRVVDADTGEPIPLFYIESGYPMTRTYPVHETSIVWMSTRGARGANGEYRMTVDWSGDTLHYRALAEGYEPAESGAVTVEESEVTLNFELRRKEEAEESADMSQIDMGAVDVTLLAQAQGCLTRRFLILEALARQERAAGRQLASTPLESSLQAADAP